MSTDPNGSAEPSVSFTGSRVRNAKSVLDYKVVRYWLPVLGMLAVMYWFSTDALSGENTRGIIETVLSWTILSWFGYHPGNTFLLNINYFARKCAHFTEYAVLAALLFRAFRADSTYRWRFKWALYSLVVIVSWAALDEWHQTFTHTRGGSIWDSLLDTSGGSFALVIITLFSLRSTHAPSGEPRRALHGGLIVAPSPGASTRERARPRSSRRQPTRRRRNAQESGDAV